MTQVIETDEAGRLTLSPDILREIFGETHPQARYLVEVEGTKIFVSPDQMAEKAEAAELTPEQWEAQWRKVQEQLGRSWPPGLSAADVVSEMRR